MTELKLEQGIRNAAPNAPAACIEGIEQAAAELQAMGFVSVLSWAHLIGQCAHESMGFSHIEESLYYSTASRIRAVWPSRFASDAAAQPYVKNSRKLANHVYCDRMGNGSESSGDGYQYRGRGYIQLTGRANYCTFGELIEAPLEDDPVLACDPYVGWMVAGQYFVTRSRNSKTCLAWAELDDCEQVTRIINGGTHGLDDRRKLTRLAFAGLQGDIARPVLRQGDRGAAVETCQHALIAHGCSPGAPDGQFGPATYSAVLAFQRVHDLDADGVVGSATWAALDDAP